MTKVLEHEGVLFKGGVDFWAALDRDLRRTHRMITWMIDGQFQHGISPMAFGNITPELIEGLYDVDFGD